MTAPFSGGSRALQHAGGSAMHHPGHWLPAAKQFMGPDRRNDLLGDAVCKEVASLVLM